MPKWRWPRRPCPWLGLADDLTTFDVVTLVHMHLAQMRVEGVHAKAVVDDDNLAVNPHEFRENDAALIACRYG